MIRKITLLLFVCLCLNYVTKAQYCGFDKTHQQAMATDPSFAQRVNQFNTQWAQYLAIQSNPNSLITINGTDTTYEIPVVIHVIHTGGAIGSTYNPSDATLQRLIDTVNRTYAATLPIAGYPDKTTGGTRIPLKFVLAKRDPNCATTNGIVRVDGTSLGGNYISDGMDHGGGSGVAEATVKNLSRWPRDEYYNIWVVNKIDGYDGTSGSGVAGFAWFPGAAANVDGTVMLASQATGGAAINNHNHVLSHELGHAFGLYHVFQGGDLTTCPPLAPGSGDLCPDTEPIKQSPVGTCPSGTNSCTGNSYNFTQENYMDYSNCKDRFTTNQKDRIMTALLTQRTGLISSLGATPLPSVSMPTVCIPTYGNTSSPLDRGPTRVEIRDGSLSLMNVTSGGYIGDGNRVYIDNTCKHMVTLISGQTYEFRVSTSATNQVSKAYIDLNNDGILGNSVGETISLARTGTLHSANYTVPISSNVVGCTPIRMRIVSDQAATVDSCNQLQYGQAEDYSVTIQGVGGGAASIAVNNPPIGGNPSCLGTTLTLTTSLAGGPIVTNYAWFKRSIGGSVVPGPSCPTCSTWTSSAFADRDTAWVVMSYQNACGNADTTSNKLLLFRPLTVPPSVTIGLVYGTFPSCIDDSISIAVTTNVNPGASPQYQWKVNNINNGALTTNPTFNATGLPDNSVVSVVMNSSAGACASPSSATSNNVVIDTAVKTPSVTVSLISGTNPGCSGQLLSFKAFPKVGGTNPSYRWYKNSVLVPGVTGDTYTSVFNDLDQVFVRITSNSPCSVPSPNNTATSTPITVNHIKLTADITIAQVSGTNPACSQKLVAFAANATSAGINPSYQWLLNGQIIPNANGVTYLTDSLKDNDVLKCVLLSTDPCVLNPQDTSNEIIMMVIPSRVPSINISITDGKNPGCLDSLVQFTAIATDIGNNPFFTWKINSFDVSFGSGVYSSSSFLNGDVVVACASQTDGGCYLPDTVCSAPFNMVRSTTPNPPLIHLIGNKLVTGIQPGSYVWFGPNNRENAGGEDGNFLPQEPGYYYAVTNNNGCYSKPSNQLKIILLDINTIDLQGLKVYPNPTTGKLTLDWDKAQEGTDIDIYNPLGQVLIHEKMINQSRKDLDLSSLANGIYYVVIKDQQGKVGNVKISLTR